jgi:hypothetical protein
MGFRFARRARTGMQLWFPLRHNAPYIQSISWS